MVGGVTYEESRYVSEMNTANPGVRVLLGGTTIHSSASCLEEVKRLPSAGGAPTPQPMQQPGLDSLTGGLSGLGIAAPSIDSKRIKASLASYLQNVPHNLCIFAVPGRSFFTYGALFLLKAQ